jgi:translation elongation factor EF-1beta
VDVPIISIHIVLQACKNQCKDTSVQTQADLHDEKLKAMPSEKDVEIKELETERENVVRGLKNQLEVRNISMYEVCFTLTSRELKVMCHFCHTKCAFDSSSDSNFLFYSIMM